MFTNNKNFYPTPENLIARMIAKINRNVRTVLEPSAGKGDIIEALKAHYYHAYPDIMACEIDPNLQAVLRDKKINIIDTDFLAFTGPDKFDLIIANPPFDEGAKHLLKAMDIMYRGQIIFLLNAETLRNPFTNERKLLVRRLEEAGASIEYIKSAFVDAERTTEVEVALVNITIDRKVEEDLFAGATDWAADSYETIEDKYEVSNGREVAELVADYNETIRVGTDVILTYFRNYRRIGGFISMLDADQAKYSHYSSGDLTEKMQKALNELLRSVRKFFWRKTLSIDAVRSRLTKKKQSEFEHMLATQSHMDFTESNIYQFITNLVDGWEKTFTDALLDIFDMFTIRHSYHGKLHEKNIWMFNGWKTNNAYAVGKKVVIPVYGSYGGAFFDTCFNRWHLNSAAADTLRDIDIVMNTLNGGGEYLSISRAIERAIHGGYTSGIESTYFKFTIHKKNTIHLTFKNEDILRRFNVMACRGKGWLPGDFGAKAYAELSCEEKTVVDSFEGEKSYEKNRTKPLIPFAGPALVGLPMLSQVDEAGQPDLFSLAA